ncbi:MAG: phosphohydrolase, partial [Erysipelotrichales bacterium]|nr:phosphohydrolase [Erysipelotrichales bacterium]
MSYITTYSGIHFTPTDPDPSQIEIRDIAHSLSLLCRANGHFKYFYTVAQHSLACALEAKARNHSVRVQLGCLLHDAAEAYVSDVTRPIKALLPEYLPIEDRLF